MGSQSSTTFIGRDFGSQSLNGPHNELQLGCANQSIPKTLGEEVLEQQRKTMRI